MPIDRSFIMLLVAAVVAACDFRSFQAEDYFPAGPQTELAKALETGSSDRIRMAIADGAIIDFEGRDGVSPLIWAMVKRSHAGFKALLDSGASPNLVTTMNEETDAFTSVIVLASRHQDSRFLEALLEHGGDPNLITDHTQRTPIYDALLFDRTDNVRLLLDAGADIDHKDLSETTPFHYAAGTGNLRHALLLLNRGADADVPNRWGFTANDTLRRMDSAGGLPGPASQRDYEELFERLQLERVGE